MRRLLLLLLFITSVASAQISKGILITNTDPAGSCPNGSQLRYNYTNNKLWGCENGTWTQITGGGGGGATIPSVTNVIKGDGAGNGADTKVSITSPTTHAALSFPVDNATITFQGTDTYIGRATTDTLTNKTFDTAGAGNSFKINGTGITAVSGTGSVCLTISCAMTTPNLGIPSALDLTNAVLGSNTILATLTGAQTLTNKTLTNPSLGAAPSGLSISLPNEGATGTTVNTLAKLTSASPSTVIIAATTDTDGVTGIVVSGAGTTGSAQLARDGTAACVFDGATTAGDYVQISSTVAGNCHDTGSTTRPTSGQIIGRVLSTNGAGGTYNMTISGMGIAGVPSSSAFSALTSGTNTTAAMLCGAGCSLGPTSTGTVKATSVVDSNQLPVLTAVAAATAVDFVSITNAATANPATVKILAAGSDSNINLQLGGKGTGNVFTDVEAIGATSTDGYVLQNLTAAANNTQQWSPRLRFIGQGWKTAATAASQQVEFIAELVPSQSTTNPDATLEFTAAINGTRAIKPTMYLCASGTLNGSTYGMFGLDGGSAINGCNGSNGFSGFGGSNASNVFAAYNNAVARTMFHVNGMSLSSAGFLFWTAGALGTTVVGDTGLTRGAAGQVNVNDGSITATNYRDLKLRSLISGGTVPGISGCTAGTQTGGGTAGTYSSGTTGTCTVTLTFALTAPTGWACTQNDLTTPADVQKQSASSTTTATITGTTVTADVINFACTAY